MNNNQTISVLEAAQWLARMATIDGTVSAKGLALLQEFANAFGLDLSTFEQLETKNSKSPAIDPTKQEIEIGGNAPKPKIRPTCEIKKSKEKTSQPKMSIRMPDGKLISRDKMTDTFRDFIMGMGWEDVRYLNFDVYGKDLITQEHPNGWYKELVPGWYVNTDMKAKTMRTTAYEIARALGKKNRSLMGLRVHWTINVKIQRGHKGIRNMHRSALA